ncbi:uncharacterized protein LOC142640690 [Castanea sativa]|uniref:uncharacterized protein LOC142640690 n=1 Tax=Castanea sativa TaxID=21020 RepID=UPI003F65302B
MEAARMRASVRASATARKKEEEKKEKGKEGASSSAPKVIGKGAPRRKTNGKDDRPSKKACVTSGEKQPKKPLPPKLSHGSGKGLMTSSDPITQGTHCLLTHKIYAVEMVESIIKETNVDPCVEQEMEELRASGVFYLSRALVRMKVLRDRCVAEEGVISQAQ